MLRLVLNACMIKTTAAEILANPATRTRQAMMTISLNPLRSGDFAMKGGCLSVWMPFGFRLFVSCRSLIGSHLLKSRRRRSNNCLA
jgi:hypothetical protein